MNDEARRKLKKFVFWMAVLSLAVLAIQFYYFSFGRTVFRKVILSEDGKASVELVVKQGRRDGLLLIPHIGLVFAFVGFEGELYANTPQGLEWICDLDDVSGDEWSRIRLEGKTLHRIPSVGDREISGSLLMTQGEIEGR